MIAAVSPTSASSRNGTPAPRSDRASKPPARLAGSLDTSRPYCTNLRPKHSLGDQGSGLHAKHFRDPFGAHRTGPQDARGGSGQVDDRRRGLLLRRTRVEIDVDEIAELAARLVGVHGGRAAGDVGARYRDGPHLAQQV